MLNIYPKLKGIQVMDDEGGLLPAAWANRWPRAAGLFGVGAAAVTFVCGVAAATTLSTRGPIDVAFLRAAGGVERGLRHEERRGGRSGVPDLSITGWFKTTWWEFKYADPDFDSEGLQELTMLRCAAIGAGGWYVIFEDVKDRKSTRLNSSH